MYEPKRLYMSQLINYYRKSFLDSTTTSCTMDHSCGCTVNYRYERDSEPTYLYFGHNEGLDVIQKYIKDLEKKVDELQYVERIIQMARRTQND